MASNSDIEVKVGYKDVGLEQGIKRSQKEIVSLGKQLGVLANDFNQLKITEKEFIAETNKTNSRLNTLNKAVYASAKSTKGLSGALSANAIPATQEFSRVIQDLPYGMQGVANNIQQLTAQFGYLATKSGGVGNALKAMASSLIGPAGILLAVSLVTAAWPLLVEAFSKSKESLDDTKESVDSLTNAYTRYLQKSKDAQTLIDEQTKMQIALAKLNGATEKELNKITAEGVSKRIAAIGGELQKREKLIEKYVLEANRLFNKGGKENLQLSDQYNLEITKLLRKSEEDRISIQKLGNTIVLSDLALSLKEKEELHKKSVENIKKINEGLFRDTPRFSGMGVGTFDDRGGSAFSGMFMGISDELKAMTPEWVVALDNAAVVVQEGVDKVGKSFEAGATKAGQLAQALSQVMVDTFTGIGEFIGDALSSSASGIDVNGRKVLNSFGKFLGDLGKMAIAYGSFQLAMAIASDGPPTIASAGIMIAAGIGMVAVGKAIQNMTKEAPSAASGGYSGGSSSSFRGSSSSAVSTGSGGGTYVFEIEGTKLVGVLSNTLNRNKALGGSLSLV